MTRRERSMTLATIAAGLLAGLLWGYVRLSTARDAAAAAETSLVECRRLAAQVNAQQGNPAEPLTAGREPQSAELIRRIESAARLAEFTPRSIERIEPGPVRRLDDGPFSEKPTTVELRGVTLRQLFTFLHAAGAGRGGLQLRDIRLSAPSPDDAGDRWSVQATLAYLLSESGNTQVQTRER